MNTYVYGIVSANHPKKLEGVGVGGDGLRVVEAGEVAAVVSDAPASLHAKRRELFAHEQVLETLCAQGVTLPMRFGLLADDDAALAREMSAQRSGYLTLLSQLEGKAEMNVKARHYEDASLRSVLAQDAELRRMNHELHSRGGSNSERARFGELVAAAVQQQELHDADAIAEALDPHAFQRADGPAVNGCFVNSSFLVDSAATDAFLAAAEELRESARDAVDLRVRGPLPPYSFTTSPA